MQERIFDRLGLKNTSMPDRTSNAIPDPHAHGYIFGELKEAMETGGQLSPEQQAAAKAGTLKPTDVTDTNPSMAWAAGSVISTAEDFARYVKALVGGGLLDAQLQQRRLESLQPVDPADPTGTRYGYQMETFGPMIGHSGGIPGFGSMGYHDPKRDLTMVVWVTLNASPDGRDTVAEIGKAIIAELY
jgi:D-alanyl-D-alanine carboxypeptidase